jgi:hypothetical protein
MRFHLNPSISLICPRIYIQNGLESSLREKRFSSTTPRWPSITVSISLQRSTRL